MVTKKTSKKKTVSKTASKSVENEKICAILQYFFPIGLIWYFVDENMKKSAFAKFHLKQSLVLVIFAIIVNVVGSIIPFLGWFVILPLGNLIILVLFIMGLIKAVNGEEKELPIIGKFASKFTF